RWLSSMARHSSEAGSVARRPPWKSPSWNSTSARASSTAAARLLQLDQFRVLQEAVHAADRDVHQARQAVQAAEAEEIEFDEAHQRREGELEQAGAAAEPVQFLRGERAVAVLLVEVAAEALGRLVQQVALQRARRDGVEDFL